MSHQHNEARKEQNFDKHQLAERKSGVVSLDGAELRYLVEGRGVPCLVVGSSIYYPRTFSQEVRQHFKFVFVDTRHFVPSTKPVDLDGITIDSYSRDLEEVRRTLGLEKIAVLGHSIHGTLALEYARRYPDHVSHVIAIGALPVEINELIVPSEEYWTSNASEERERCMQKNWEQLGFDALSRMPPGEAMIKSFIRDGPKYWYDPEYDASWLWDGIEFNIEMTDHVWGRMFNGYDISRQTARITAPVFFALGRHDYIVPYAIWDERRELFPHLSYHLFDKSGHTPQLEEARLFDQKLIEWIHGTENDNRRYSEIEQEPGSREEKTCNP